MRIGSAMYRQNWAVLAPMFSDASRHSFFKPSMAGAMIRIIRGSWK